MTEKLITQYIDEQIKALENKLQYWQELNKSPKWYQKEKVLAHIKTSFRDNEKEKLKQEKQHLLDLLRELTIRTNLTLPTNDKEEKWFNERTQKQHSFRIKLLKTLRRGS